ncbi:hypothetical protein B0F90DRAFT_1738591 [Multifurca ochricompacta]|uniref:Uncharacterized protein n=1 Tax=Multifurca ochricompacta TaxID=376703 RepID=A0AAD4LV38_9AGAM|nr:hypothetical protein B0F90DRAFT_1785211 [Multifurca ochricompacta]KAI0290530.1 hypothetical protein B0F90DRAFT_1785214 [Multifurca ochricompacta]KAI0297616.1 hypothetical protein B0F90DRAFT_1738588 [Multifurca ochricompacta]KAI0297617.1 hypothetical protein B0F90DRAFT_1738591 [Multifurca ochricompacta]
MLTLILMLTLMLMLTPLLTLRRRVMVLLSCLALFFVLLIIDAQRAGFGSNAIEVVDGLLLLKRVDVPFFYTRLQLVE